MFSFLRLLGGISDTLDLLLSTSDIIIGEHVLEENEVFDAPPYKMQGCVLTMVEHLDKEFTKVIKECDPHSNECVERYLYVY
jgi:translation initiation factor 3 subunit C